MMRGDGGEDGEASMCMTWWWWHKQHQNAIEGQGTAARTWTSWDMEKKKTKSWNYGGASHMLDLNLCCSLQMLKPSLPGPNRGTRLEIAK